MPSHLQLLLDQGLPRDAAQILRDLGIDCRHVGEFGMSAAEDLNIIEWARERKYAIVTLDSDFHALLILRKATSPSVVRIRLEGLNGPALALLLKPIVHGYHSELVAGCMLTVKKSKITCRLFAR